MTCCDHVGARKFWQARAKFGKSRKSGEEEVGVQVSGQKVKDHDGLYREERRQPTGANLNIVTRKDRNRFREFKITNSN